MIFNLLDANRFAAWIVVNVDSGSTVTATLGSCVLTATASNGQAMFRVPRAGNWTIKGTLGGNSDTATVSITERRQKKSVTLQYITYLFNNGDTCDAITGGWSIGATSAGSASTSGQQISIVANAEKTFSCSTKNKIDVSEYEALSVTVDSISRGSLSIYLYVTSPSRPTARVVTQKTGTVSLDISSVSGANTVILSFHSEKGGSVKVSEVSLM